MGMGLRRIKSPEGLNLGFSQQGQGRGLRGPAEPPEEIILLCLIWKEKTCFFFSVSETVFLLAGSFGSRENSIISWMAPLLWGAAQVHSLLWELPTSSSPPRSPLRKFTPRPKPTKAGLSRMFGMFGCEVVLHINTPSHLHEGNVLLLPSSHPRSSEAESDLPEQKWERVTASIPGSPEHPEGAQLLPKNAPPHRRGKNIWNDA